jgi:hypothetical protein
VTSFCKKSHLRIKGTNIYCLTVLLDKRNYTAYCGNYDVAQKLPKWNIYFRNSSINDKNNIGPRREIREHRNLKGGREPWDINPFFENIQQGDLDTGELNTEYNRGHLVPFTEMRYTMKAGLSTFLFTNMAPQNKKINEQSWNNLENLIKKFGFGKSFFVVTGVCMERLDKQVYKNPPKCFWKLICTKFDKDVSVVSFYQDNAKVNKFEMMSQSDLFKAIGTKETYLDELWTNFLFNKLSDTTEIKPNECRESKHIQEKHKSFWNMEFASKKDSAVPLK